MTGFELLAALADSLAWPLVALVVAIVFRHQLAALLARPFAHLKAGPLEIRWDRAAAEVKAELRSAPPPADRPPGENPADDDLAELAHISPASTVIQAFIRVERQLRALLVGAGIETTGGHARVLARRALEAGLIRPETMTAIEGITVLRNLAAHGRAGDLDTARAMDYLALTDAVSYALMQSGESSTLTG